MISDLFYSRIASRDLRMNSQAMRAEIRPDSTPVPIFGNYKEANIVTVGINPSSKEFPSAKKERRLVHLSDIGLSPYFFQNGDDSMTLDQTILIEQGLINYFQTDNTNWDWFGHAEDSLNLGFRASYMGGENSQIVCHVDLFPWATKKASSLDKEVRKEFMLENASFVERYLSQESVTNLVLLGNDSKNGISKQLELEFEILKSEPGPCSSRFEFGNIKFGSTSKRFYYTSKGPSVQFTQPLEKKKIHNAFGVFIRDCRSDTSEV